MLARPATRLQAITLYTLTAVIFVLTFIVRYAAPEGAFGGLTDDHFYFVTPGWQMLFGEWPDRDYFEPGAPLMLLISALLQVVGGRSVLPEYAFCVTVLAAGGALTFLLASEASGSIALGLLAWLFQFALLPRLYGYPKIVMYAAAITAMWAWASSPRFGKTVGIAAIAVVAFLLRHDHGIYIVGAFLVLVCFVQGMAILLRLKHVGLFVLAAGLMLSPYLAYLQLNGGIERHFVNTYAWAARDYSRAPRVLPTVETQPLFDDSASDAPASEWWEHAPWTTLSDYSPVWLFWLFNAIPIIALALLLVRPAEGPPNWLQERAKLLVVIALAAVLDYRFLRGNIGGRLADVSVPVVILTAWILSGVVAIVWTGRLQVRGRARTAGTLARGLLAAAAVLVVVVSALVLVRPVRNAIEKVRVLEGLEDTGFALNLVTDRLGHTWPLPSARSDESADFVLARYLQTCTSPTDRVLVTENRPQIVGLAQRAFAAGHQDMRGGGFFGTDAEQELIVERWRLQSVPVVIGPAPDDYRDWTQDLPIVARYLEREYVNLGERDVSGFTFLLFVRRTARVVRTFPAYDLPCFR